MTDFWLEQVGRCHCFVKGRVRWARQNEPDLPGECQEALLWNTKVTKELCCGSCPGHVPEERSCPVTLPCSLFISDSHAAYRSLLRTHTATRKGLCGEAMETALCASCFCTVVPLLSLGLAHETLLLGDLPALYKKHCYLGYFFCK